jgi:recombinational DNA repair protein RecT
MQAYEGQVGQLLGQKYGMTAQEFTITCVNAIKKTPKLLECNIKSLFGAVLLSAELGLKPNTPDGLAYILPYGKEAQFQIGYKGLIEIAMRSDQVKQIYGGAIYENEFYEETEGSYKYVKYTGMDTNKMELAKLRSDKLKSIGLSQEEITKDITAYKTKLEKGKGALVLVYAVCFLEGKDEPIQVSVTKDVLERIKQISPSKQSASANDVHDMMKVKAAIKKLYKFLPKTGNPEMGRAVELDDASIMGSYPNITEDGEVQIVTVDEQKKETQSNKITNALKETQEAPKTHLGEIKERIKACKTVQQLDDLFEVTESADEHLEDFKARREELKAK